MLFSNVFLALFAAAGVFARSNQTTTHIIGGNGTTNGSNGTTNGTSSLVPSSYENNVGKSSLPLAVGVVGAAVALLM